MDFDIEMDDAVPDTAPPLLEEEYTTDIITGEEQVGKTL